MPHMDAVASISNIYIAYLMAISHNADIIISHNADIIISYNESHNADNNFITKIMM